MSDPYELEGWCPIPGYEGIYEVSDMGRVQRIASWVAGKGGVRKPGLRRLSVKRTGYVEVVLKRNGVTEYLLVHRLVMRAFRGLPPARGYEVNHKDTNRANNWLENLEYTTKKGNAQHSIRMGRRDHFKRDLTTGRYVKASP